MVYYPAAGAPGGGPINNAPVAAGVFPVCAYQHGYTGTPQGSLGMIRPLAAAGFIVPALSMPGPPSATQPTATWPGTTRKSSPERWP